MELAKRKAILLTVIAVVLCILQAGIWMRSTAHEHSEIQKADAESQNPPTEIPGIAGFCLFIAAAVIVSVPHSPFGE
jgi:uncharacterized membrane protein YidH (DUF202 family)